MSGTDLDYGGVWYSRRLWRGQCGTERGYGATCYAMCGTEIGYGATRLLGLLSRDHTYTAVTQGTASLLP
eukprot:2983948-Rhodomonas_salina.4